MTGSNTGSNATAPAAGRAAGRRFFGYALVGVAGTLLHWLVYAVLVLADVAPVVATTLGAIAGAGLNYGLNLRLVFRTQDRYLQRLLRFMMVACIGILINGAVVSLLHAYHVWLAQVCATGLVLLSGYWLNARWTFAKARAPDTDRMG